MFHFIQIQRLTRLYMFCCCSIISHVPLFTVLWTVAYQASLSSAISWSLLKPMSIESVMLSNHLILCHPLLPVPPIFPSIRVFSSESALCSGGQSMGASVGASIFIPCNEYSGLISFRVDWFDLLAVQGTLKTLLQHCNSKASILLKDGTQSFLWFNSQILQDYWKNHCFDCVGLCPQTDVSAFQYTA